jgi:hypothetical protein
MLWFPLFQVFLQMYVKKNSYIHFFRGIRRGRVPSVPITTKVVSSNPVHGEVYLMQHYLITFVSDFQ